MIEPLTQLRLKQAPAQYSQHDVYYVEQGQGDLILLVHGSLCDLRYWRWQLNKLAPFGRIVSLSLPGCWPSEALYMAYDFELENQCAALHDVIEATQQSGQRIHLVGHSRGAHVVTHYLKRFPHSVTSVVLADPAFEPYQAPTSLPILDEAARLIAAGAESEGLGLFIDAVSGPNTWSQMVGWFKTMVQDNAHTLIAQSREQLVLISPAHLHALAQQPVLLLGGALSPERYQRSINALKKELPRAHQASITHASHGMNLSNPKGFNQALMHFFQAIA
ncbi:MAG TPA: alpha/beta hydrolase [Paenalcaligenes hominis]|uniref:Alpha/beta hydrolase n=1 Tax=Paenalcaligenes hominis TaxID=643674 RepID=A0A9D2VED3_9BURK|nr:alpha/beta hydrolase [Paenalcaligenes hominis]